jgi:hypothetical protein
VSVFSFAVDTNSGALRWISDPFYVKIRELTPYRRLTKKAAPPIKDTEERQDFVNLRYCVDIVINTKHTNAFRHRAQKQGVYLAGQQAVIRIPLPRHKGWLVSSSVSVPILSALESADRCSSAARQVRTQTRSGGSTY